MCDYRDAYLGVKRTITVQGPNVNDWTDGILTFKNKDPFRQCVSNINNTFLDNSVIFILWHQEVCGIIKETKWMMKLMKIMLIILG